MRYWQVHHLLQLFLQAFESLLVSNHDRSLDVLQDTLVTCELRRGSRRDRNTPHRIFVRRGSHPFLGFGKLFGQFVVLAALHSLFQSRESDFVTFDRGESDRDLHQVRAVNRSM
jgi:hypothetical protein